MKSSCLRRLAFALAATIAFALPARAGSLTVDFTDLWWKDPAGSEDGWGVNIVQQSDTLFLTFFVYGSDGAARWIVAPNLTQPGGPASTTLRYEGDVYRTKGPWFGGPFDNSKVEREKVGVAAITFDSANAANLVYTVDGVTVEKRVRRQSFRANSATGVYAGGIVATASQCAADGDNGSAFFWGDLTVTQSNASIAMQLDFHTSSGAVMACVFSGSVEVQGRLAAVPSGSFTCRIGNTVYNTGTFSLSALDSQMNGLHASFSGRDQYCSYTGRMGGTRLPGT